MPKQTALCGNTCFALVLHSCNRQLYFLGCSIANPSSCLRASPHCLSHRHALLSTLEVGRDHILMFPTSSGLNMGTWSLANDNFFQKFESWPIDKKTKRWWWDIIRSSEEIIPRGLRWNPKEAAAGPYNRGGCVLLFLQTFSSFLASQSYLGLYLFF